MQTKTPSKKGFRLRSIVLHSLWITIIGILLFRLATANTQRVLYVKFFAISGTILATVPWIFHLLVSTTIILLYKANVCDLTWIVKLPSEETSCCQEMKAVKEAIRGSDRIGIGNAHKDLGLSEKVDGIRNGPDLLERNRTV
ncbi:uncharacterized protein LOC110667353 [Hevea brasiliensis]|uniref:uncharacterized protein LOC110667353 n=1 Tax=Hevea brasiliensis TaxID=3981 RepID=UPI0025D22B3C|nr:uncharacterized protein LOC110667353 [Hevea brasiliensis]